MANPMFSAVYPARFYMNTATLRYAEPPTHYSCFNLLDAAGKDKTDEVVTDAAGISESYGRRDQYFTGSMTKVNREH
jgi:hypothetical protein